jgi:hypothetical protein
VYLRRLGWAALFGLSLLPGRSLLGSEPARLDLPAATPIPATASANSQKLADSIANQLKLAATLKNYRVDIAVRGGTVELTGTVADQAQREEVLRLVQGMPGVVRVSDQMQLITPAIKVAALEDKVKEGKPGKPDAGAPPIEPLPAPGGSPSNANGPIPEPQPIFSAANCAPGMGGGYSAANPPAMPPHAWPTYAPYNNYSRVAYPLAYPYKSWPFIGPVYPYPKVPLGWRSVKLEWDDGYWWYSRVGCKHDWWKLRYW